MSIETILDSDMIEKDFAGARARVQSAVDSAPSSVTLSAARSQVAASMKRTTNPGGTGQEWEQVAERVNAGDFDKADKSTVESVTIGLRSFDSPVVRSAKERLKKVKV